MHHVPGSASSSRGCVRTCSYAHVCIYDGSDTTFIYICKLCERQGGCTCRYAGGGDGEVRGSSCHGAHAFVVLLGLSVCMR